MGLWDFPSYPRGMRLFTCLRAPFRPSARVLAFGLVLPIAGLSLQGCAYGLDPSLEDGEGIDGEGDDPGGPTGPLGTGTTDGGSRRVDSGARDAGARDAADGGPKFQDADGGRDGSIDGNREDADESPRDAGRPDVVTDANTIDAGRDAGALEGGRPEAGPLEAGTIDGAVVPGAWAEDCLLISEYLESSSNRRAIELWNRCAQSVSLASVRLCLETNNQTHCKEDTSLASAGSVAAGDVIVVCHPNFRDPRCDVSNDAVDYNGDDRIAVFVDADRNGRVDRGSDALVDSFGRLGFSPPNGVVPAVSRPWEDVDYRRIACAPYRGTSTFAANALYAATSSSDLTNLGVPPSLTCP